MKKKKKETQHLRVFKKENRNFNFDNIIQLV